jgi:acetyl esterase
LTIKDRLAARVMQAVLGRLARPPASALLVGADLPLPQPVTVPTEDGPVRVHIYRAPGTAGEAPVYVNFHGGGFIARHPEYDDHICRALVAETGCVVVNVDYDVAPQRPFPVAPRQAWAVTEWVARNGKTQGWDGERLAVGGQSAGGNLAAGICLVARDRGTLTPVLQILNYPPLDLATDPSAKVARTAKPLIRPSLATLFNNAYTPDPATRRDPLASPLLAGSLAGVAPALVITAEYDLLRDEGDNYAQRLAEAGVSVSHHVMPGVDHAYTHSEPTGPLRDALTLMADALTKAWK